MKWIERNFQNNSGLADAATARLTPLPPGTTAPDFTMDATSGEKLSLADFRGQRVILAFYPADKSPVCSNQLALYNEALPIFKELNAQLLGISVDDIPSHQAFSEQLNLSFPLLADTDPAGGVAQAYGVYDEQGGVCERALFVIDEEGEVRWSMISPRGVNPGAEGILATLESMSE